MELDEPQVSVDWRSRLSEGGMSDGCGREDRYGGAEQTQVRYQDLLVTG